MSRSSTSEARPSVKRELHILTTGSWTVPADIIRGSLMALVIGGGSSGSLGGPGVGGNGGACVQRRLDPDPNTEIAVLIGAGGAAVPGGQTATNGISGATSAFGSLNAVGGTGPNTNSLAASAVEGGGIGSVGGNPACAGSFPPYSTGGQSTTATTPLPGQAAQNRPAAANTGNGGGAGNTTGTIQSGAGSSGRVVLTWEEES